MKTTKCFYGIEAEGPDRGDRVLFVPGTTPPGVFLEALHARESEEVERVYLGAGEDRFINPWTLAAVLNAGDRPGSAFVTVEVDRVPEEMSFLRQTFVTVVSLYKPDLGAGADFYKYETEDEIVWVDEDGKEYRTAKNDPLFAQDKEI